MTLTLDPIPHPHGATLFHVRAPSVGLDAYIAIDSLVEGRAIGGIRRRAYATPADAIAEVSALAAQMTLKTKAAELPCGGAKSVLRDHPGLDRDGAYATLGEAIELLVTAHDITYYCGPDVGTGERELGAVRRSTGLVNAASNDPGRRTAEGVLSAIDALIERGPDVRTALVEGLGSVGGRVASGLGGRGVETFATDIDEDAVTRLARGWVGPGALRRGSGARWERTARVDLLAPCALGPVVTAANIDDLRCRIICGAANTQLESPEMEARLAARGIVYVPDYLVNAGAIIEGITTWLNPGEDVTAKVDAQISAIGGRVVRLLAG